MTAERPDLRGQARRLAEALRTAAERFPGNEMGFRHEAEAALDALAREHGIELHKRPELTLAGGRADAVFNRLVVEWEPPGALAAHVDHPPNRHAVDQLRAYVDGLAERERREVERLLGVACDGRFVVFARYRAGRWIVDEPVPVDERSAEQLLESLLAAHAGRALTAANLLRDFGPGTPLTRRVSRALLVHLEARLGHVPDGLEARLYRQWETLFAVATGVVGEAEELKADARRALGEVFGLGGEIEPGRALFALQTYFSIVTKLIALLALSLFVPGVELRLSEMAVAGDDDLWEDMDELQHGGPFRSAGLANVVEPDVFGWYLGGTPDVREAVREVVAELADYDPTTLHVSPEDARDLLKDLYQGLLPRPVRHALGQYFTPDWLAQQLLQQLQYDGRPDLRVVDPACGTGTFLVLAIVELKERLRRARKPEREILDAVLRNVVGFDIDPLAAVAARTNYVLALGSLIRAVPPGELLDVPVYLADSIVTPALGETLVSGDRLLLETAAGTFSLPTCIDTGEELRDVCDLAAAGVEAARPVDEFVAEAAGACAADARAREVLAEFYVGCVEQHARGLDGLWPHVLRNAFMPAFIGRFDLVVGNPPWVNWESLPGAYRERTRPLWERSGLFVHGGMEAMLGAGKKDVSMLLSYVASDKLLKPDGRLGFVITQTVFKTAGAGQGFRRFRVGDVGPALHVERVDDLVDLNPFVGATNRTALVHWRRDAPTEYPVAYVLWQRRPGGKRIPADATLDDVRERVETLELVAAPVRDDDPTSAWLTAPVELVPALRKLAERGEPAYTAHAGVYTGANGVYWIAVAGPPDSDGTVPITNLHDIGKTRIPRRYGRAESELIHPHLRGSDIHRWNAQPSVELLLVQDVDERRGIAPETMAERYPHALAYLAQFEKVLRARAAFRRYFTRGSGGNRVETGPYWSMFDVGGYTLAPHKVAWRDQASELTAAVLPSGEPLPLPNHKVMFVACESDDEAHYLCGALNSAPFRCFVAAYTIETQLSTHPMRYVHVPKFDGAYPAHRALADASQAAHVAVAAGAEPDELAVDSAAAALWGLGAREAEAMRSFLDRLLKRAAG